MYASPAPVGAPTITDHEASNVSSTRARAAAGGKIDRCHRSTAATTSVTDHREVAALAQPFDLLRRLMQLVTSARSNSVLREGVVKDWVHIAQESQIDRSVWRGVLLKLSTRDTDYIKIARIARDGSSPGDAANSMHEGTMFRLLSALEVLYPAALERSGPLRWRVCPAGAAYVHLMQTLAELARESTDNLICADPSSTAADANPPAAVPQVETALWDHQREAVDRIMEGIRAGKRGFADASAVS